MLLRFSRFVRWNREHNREEMAHAAGITIGEIMRTLPLRRIKTKQRDKLFQHMITLAKKTCVPASEEIFAIAKENLYSDEILFVPDVNQLIQKLKNLSKYDPTIPKLQEYADCLEYATELQQKCLEEYNMSPLRKINHHNNSVIFYFDGLTQYLNIQHLQEIRTNENKMHIDI